jgi:hypothetical protein
LVALRLADEADGNGYIDRLTHATLARRMPSLGRRRVREILGALQAKKLLKHRTHRYGKNGAQISNSYQLDLKRYHPPDPVGDDLWKQCCAIVAGQRGDGWKEATRFHALDSSAYYDPALKLLFVVLDSKRSLSFFDVKRDLIVNRSFEFTPPVTRLDFFVP